MDPVKIGSRIVHCDNEAAHLGIHYLFTLEPGEQESFFIAAKGRPTTGFKFEDRDGRNFTLKRIGDGVYKVETRGSDSGGWF
jgi:hypothetical protein